MMEIYIVTASYTYEGTTYAYARLLRERKVNGRTNVLIKILGCR